MTEAPAEQVRGGWGESSPLAAPACGVLASDIPTGPVDGSSVWLNGQFVSYEKYHNFQSNSYAQKTDRFTAIVQSNLFNVGAHGSTGVKGEIFTKFGFTLGCNEKPTDPSCGEIRARIMCSADSGHHSYYKHRRCNDPGCPVCYSKFANRIAEGSTNRVMGYRSVYGFDPISHLIFWGEYREGYPDLKTAFAAANKRLKVMGVTAAAVWYHPYRIRNEIKEQLRRYKRCAGLDKSIGFWQMAHDDVLELGCLDAYIIPGPHFHAVATGYLMKWTEYAKKGLGGYKKVRRLDTEEDLRRVAYYLSTHACREFGKQMVHYFGNMSNAKLCHDEGETVIEDVLCPKCGKFCVEYYCDDTGNTTDMVHDHVTRKVLKYKYWKRGDKPGGKKKTRHGSIWGC